LGAFAVAHAALGETAAILSSSMGAMGAYILMNVLVIMMEGFAAGIQSLRLIYYEFSTKFYKGAGKAFKPLRF
ncbi:MAG TPA: ATPase, partial [Candidatus Bathyarchaeota archaeon]|nr:ATPase [Candidatus Bathyarchaeota archaeon]